MKRPVAISLSLATLCMLKVWRQLLDPSWDLFRSAPPARIHYMLAISSTIMLAGVFLIAWRIYSKSGPIAQNAGRVVFLLVCFITLVVAWYTYGGFQSFTDRLLQSVPPSLVVLVLPITLAFSVIFLRPLTQAAAACLLIVSPFTAFVLGSATWRSVSPRRIAQPLPSSDWTQQAPAQRVVWIIFDEMDEHIAFLDRPSQLRLPELDSFCEGALYATMATAPGTLTHYSMPALITGRPVKSVTISDGNDLMITFDGQDGIRRFSQSDNVFRDAHQRGFRTGIVGNYLAYCRILHSDLDFCSTRLAGREAGSAVTLEGAFAEQMQSFLSSLPFHDRLPALSIERTKHVANYRGVLADAKTTAADPRLNLLLIHFPIPHLPGVAGPSYVDNLILVDESLKELRQSMERAGLWQTSNVLISADHGLRTRPKFDNRVPFLLKLSGQTHGFEYSGSFNTILTRDLILFLLSKSHATPQTVSDWISTR